MAVLEVGGFGVNKEKGGEGRFGLALFTARSQDYAPAWGSGFDQIRLLA